MKSLRFAIAFVLFAFSPLAISSAQELTISELARHLGISSWRIPKDKLPDAYKVTFYHVKKGVLTKENVVGEFQKGGDLLICTQWLSNSVSVSADDGNTIISTRTALPQMPIFSIDNKFEALGTPLLLCHSLQDHTDVQGRYKDVKSEAHAMEWAKAEHGLAIVITALKP